MRREVGVLVLSVALSGCSEPLEFADWTMPVPEGTPVVEYAAVWAEDRAGHEIELTEEAMFGVGDDPATSFHRAGDVAADAAGNVYVLDQGARDIKAFRADGSYLRTLGSSGKGPGEFTNPLSLVAVGDRIIASDSTNLRLSEWDASGELIGDFRLGSLMEFLMLDASPGAAHLVGVHIGFGEDGLQRDTVSAVSRRGEELFRYTELSHPKQPRVPKAGLFPVINLPRPLPRAFAGPNGLVYVTDHREYQVIAFEGANEAAWALRVAHERERFSSSDVDYYLTKAREKRPETREDEIEWPDRYPALEALRVDGRGFLYVYPFVPGDDRPDRVPVDVYAPDGRRVFAGTIPDVRWSRAYGDHVFRVGIDPESEEYRVWRHRLIAPF